MDVKTERLRQMAPKNGCIKSIFGHFDLEPHLMDVTTASNGMFF